MKKNEKLLTIAVPVYNTQEHLEDSLNSIFKAIPKNLDAEVLIVNDGSTDHSEEIILKYKNKFPKLVKYIKQKNAGLGNVRNVVIKEAEGKYIASVDSDDMINENFFIDAIPYLEKDLDLIIYNFLTIFENTNEKAITSAIEMKSEWEDIYEGMLYTTILPSACNKIIKKELYDKLNEKYLEDKFEDFSLIPALMLTVKTFKYIDKPYYEYRIREGSIMRSNKISQMFGMINAINHLDKIINEKRELYNPNIDLEKFKFYNYSWRVEEFIIGTILKYRDELEIINNLEKVQNNMKKIISEVFNSKYYMDLLNNCNEEKRKFIKERNESFINGNFKDFLKKNKHKNNNSNIYYISSLDLYNYHHKIKPETISLFRRGINFQKRVLKKMFRI